MASAGFTGKGTVLSIGSGGTSETFTPILQMKTFQFSGQTIKFDDITNVNSPVQANAAFEEAIPALVSGGQFTTSGVFLPSDPGQIAMSAAFNGVLTDFKVQLPKGPGQTTAGNLYAFTGYVMDEPLPDVSFDKTLT